MHEVTDPLYFVIDEKLNSVDLTDKGVDLISGNSSDPTFFILPDITSQLSELEGQKDLNEEEKLAKKDEMLADYSIKSERVHTINQLLKAYAMFERDDQYVVIDLVEQLKFLVGVHFKPEPHARRQENGNENADGFRKFVVDNGNNQRQRRCHQKDLDNRVFEFFEKEFPKRFPGRRGEEVFTVFLAAFQYLRVA